MLKQGLIPQIMNQTDHYLKENIKKYLDQRKINEVEKL